MKNTQPIRMCIACRSRYPQNSLIRLKQVQKDIIAFDGIGRSFYVCCSCIADEKKRRGLSRRFRQDEEAFGTFLQTLALQIDPCA